MITIVQILSYRYPVSLYFFGRNLTLCSLAWFATSYWYGCSTTVLCKGLSSRVEYDQNVTNNLSVSFPYILKMSRFSVTGKCTRSLSPLYSFLKSQPFVASDVRQALTNFQATYFVKILLRNIVVSNSKFMNIVVILIEGNLWIII